MYTYRSLGHVLDEIGAPKESTKGDDRWRPTVWRPAASIHLYNIIYNPKDYVSNLDPSRFGEVGDFFRDVVRTVSMAKEELKKSLGRTMYDCGSIIDMHPYLQNSSRMITFTQDLGLDVEIGYWSSKFKTMNPLAYKENVRKPVIKVMGAPRKKYSPEDITFCNALADMLPVTQDSFYSFAAGFKGERGIAVLVSSPTFSLNDNKPTMDSQGLFVTGHNDAKNQAVLYRLNK